MATEQCRNCRFSKGLTKSTPFLFCRRYPPAHQGEGEAAFPVVPRDAWCGEWMSMRPGAGLPAEVGPPRTPKLSAVSEARIAEALRQIVDERA